MDPTSSNQNPAATIHFEPDTPGGKAGTGQRKKHQYSNSFFIFIFLHSRSSKNAFIGLRAFSML